MKNLCTDLATLHPASSMSQPPLQSPAVLNKIDEVVTDVAEETAEVADVNDASAENADSTTDVAEETSTAEDDSHYAHTSVADGRGPVDACASVRLNSPTAMTTPSTSVHLNSLTVMTASPILGWSSKRPREVYRKTSRESRIWNSS